MDTKVENLTPNKFGVKSMISLSTVAALCTICTGYASFDGPIPASRQYVLAQVDQLKSRLVDNSLQTNKLQLDLLRREQVDRQIQVQQETVPSVLRLYRERLDTIGDDINVTLRKNEELEREKQRINSH